MAKLFDANKWTNGTFSVVPHPTKGITTKKGVGDNVLTLTHLDGDTALSSTLDYATANKIVEVDRWAYYIEGVSEGLGKAKKTLPVAELVKAVAAGFITTVEMGNYSTARISLRPVGSTGKKASTKKPAKPIVTIA
jgi:hypothetical protein